MIVRTISPLRYASVYYNVIDPKKIGVKACEATNVCIKGDGDVEGVSGQQAIGNVSDLFILL
ncbi:TPA: hypothetical protein EYP66_15290 [Candidatus Poribacteria bacterium]|nr:hypothetical protein [Candidatus Poribacteria bacterium]